MARGFWKGLFHGAVISVAGLVAVSLLVPLPKEPGDKPAATETVNSAAVRDVVPKPKDATLIESTPTESTPLGDVSDSPAANNGPDISQPATIPNDSTGEAASPQAGVVDLPTGSEFGRGGDVVPQMPAPMSSDQQSRLTDAPAVSAPTAEPAPVAITDPGVQPVANQPDVSPSRSEAPEQDESAIPELPVIHEAGPTPQTPGLIGAGQADSLPVALPREDVDVVNEAKQGVEVEVQVTPVQAPLAEQTDESSSNSSTNAPEIPSPTLDLSIPPDLSDLRIQPE